MSKPSPSRLLRRPCLQGRRPGVARIRDGRLGGELNHCRFIKHVHTQSGDPAGLPLHTKYTSQSWTCRNSSVCAGGRAYGTDLSPVAGLDARVLCRRRFPYLEGRSSGRNWPMVAGLTVKARKTLILQRCTACWLTEACRVGHRVLARRAFCLDGPRMGPMPPSCFARILSRK